MDLYLNLGDRLSDLMSRETQQREWTWVLNKKLTSELEDLVKVVKVPFRCFFKGFARVFLGRPWHGHSGSEASKPIPIILLLIYAAPK